MTLPVETLKSVPRGKAVWNANGGFVSVLLTHLLPAIRSLERKARYLFYCCCFVRFFVNDFSTTRGPIHATFCTLAYSGSECVFSPFGGRRPPAGGKGGNEIFVTIEAHGGFVTHLLPAIRSLERKARYLFYFCCYVRFFVNDFSTTRGQIHAKFCMLAYSGSECVFSPFGGWRPPAGGKRGK